MKVKVFQFRRSCRWAERGQDDWDGEEVLEPKGGLSAWDVLSALLFLRLILVHHSLYPVFLDAPYQMAVTQGFRKAGGVTT